MNIEDYLSKRHFPLTNRQNLALDQQQLLDAINQDDLEEALSHGKRLNKRQLEILKELRGKRQIMDCLKYAWAVEIVKRHFTTGLDKICNSQFLSQRYAEFLRKKDPIYSELLRSMKDPPLAKTFVSYWTIAHTLATQSRFWLEDAVTEIIIYQVKHFRRLATHVYSQAMLGQDLLKEKKSVADLGELKPEHWSERTPWRVQVQQSALRAIDILIGEQERERPPERKSSKAGGSSTLSDTAAQKRDEQHLTRIATSLKGPPAVESLLQCNLLVIEPDKLDGEVHAWGIRFVNPKSISAHPTRKQERVNLLRLHAYLVQEKICREPRTIHVCLAELVPRPREWEAKQHYPDYFSSRTLWSSKTLWEFIGVPFSVVTGAIQQVAKDFRKQLREGLRGLLPKENKSGQACLFDDDLS